MPWDEKHNRIAPKAGPEHFITYSMRAPIRTHWRPATCEEFECEKFLKGFVLNVDVSTELGMRQYNFAIKDKTRKFKAERVGPTLVRFTYPPGNKCFDPERSSHRVPVGRPPILLVAEGDWRGNPRGIRARVHRRPEDWVDDFATHQQRLADAIQRG